MRVSWMATIEFIERIDELTGNGGAATLLSEAEAKRVDALYKALGGWCPTLLAASFIGARYARAPETKRPARCGPRLVGGGWTLSPY